MLWWLSLLHNFIQQSLNSYPAQVHTLLAACWRFAMIRISDNVPAENKAKCFSRVKIWKKLESTCICLKTASFYCWRFSRRNFKNHYWFSFRIEIWKIWFWYLISYNESELNKKGSEVNHHLKEMCNRKNIFLIDHSKKIKASHLNSSRFYLNRKGTNILNSSLTQHILKVFNWQLSGNASCCNFSESDFEKNKSSNSKQARSQSNENDISLFPKKVVF